MRSPARGYTLAELMVVLAIAAVVLGVALPDMRRLIRHFQFDAAVSDLFMAVALTRSQAIARGSRVMLAPIDPGGSDWSRGWAVFVDSDGDSRPGASEDLIASHGPVAKGITINSVFGAQKSASYVAYNGAGRSCSASSSMAARMGTLSLFQGESTRRIKINMLGRARVCDPARDGDSCSGPDEEEQ